MKGDNVVPWSEYAKAEWARMEASWTGADPLQVDDEPWDLPVEALDDTPTDRRLWAVIAIAVVVVCVVLTVAWWD